MLTNSVKEDQQILSRMRRLVSVLEVVLFLALTIPAISLEPPRPGELEQYRKDGSFAWRVEAAKNLNNCRFHPSLVQRKIAEIKAIREGRSFISQTFPYETGLPSHGQPEIFAVLIEFPDHGHTNEESTFVDKLFGDGDQVEFPHESLKEYYERSSYNALSIQGSGADVLGWYMAEHNRSHYTRSWDPTPDYSGVQELIKEALDHYDSTHDFSVYDNNNDGRIDYFCVFWTGPDTGWHSMWWGWCDMHSIIFGGDSYTIDGKRLGIFSWQWEANDEYPPYYDDEFHPRVIIHETGHALGLPDYYDYDDGVGPDGGVGGLDMMDANRGDHNAFSKWLLGWVTPTVIGDINNIHTVTFRPSSQYADCAAIMPGQTLSNYFTEYFTVQNRSQLGNDLYIPTNGLLIWHIDARLNDSGTNFRYNNSNTDHKLLRLMEADGLEEIETGDGRADAGDFYTPGNVFSPYSEAIPNSTDYAGNYTGVSLLDITMSNLTMTAALYNYASVQILNPTQSAPVNAGPKDNPTKIDVEVQVNTHVSIHLNENDFDVQIGEKAATVPNVVELSDRYVLEIMPPTQDAKGLYDLIVSVGFASDTGTDAVEYKEADKIPLIISGSSLAPNTVTPSQQSIDIESLSFYLAGEGTALITGIEVDLIGTATDSDIAQAKLIYNSQVIDTATFSSKKLTFTPDDYLIQANPSLELKIAFDISSSAVVGHTVGVELAESSYIRVVDPAIVVSSVNFPIKSGYSTIQSEPTEKPDLTVTSVNAPDSAKQGDSINVSFTVENQGDAPSGPFHYLISLSSTNPWGTALPDSPLRLGIFPMDSVATDLPSSVTKSIQIPNNVPLGDYYVTVYADCFEVIDEGIKEDNNIGSTHPNMISIGPTDTTPPTIITKIPESNATNVLITTNIQIVFSEPMNQSATEGAFSITPNVAGSMSWQGNTLVFNPTADLEYQRTYKVIISSSATDLAGNPLAHTEWSFTTIKEGTTCFFADLDCDGDVDTEDVRRIALHWNTQVGDVLYISDYDFYSDGRINLLDVRKVAQYWGQTAPFSPLAAPPLAALMPASTGAETAIVKVNLPVQEIAVGTTSTISIEIEDVSNLGAVEFTLRYNPSIIEIQADSVEIGDFLPKNRILPLGPRFKDVDGLRELTYGLSLLGNEPGPSDNGILVRITVKGLDSGTTTLDLRKVQVVDATLAVKRIPVDIKNGSIIVLSDVACESELQVSIQNSNTSEMLPARNRLLQNYPNPFNSETWIPYQLAESSNVQIKIYNISGQLIRTLYLGYRDAGYYQDKASAAYWDGRSEVGENVASGLYFYILETGKFIATRRMVIAK